jgi:hypothetical protein
MGEFKNNPAIFDRLNFTRNNDKANGCSVYQEMIAGNGDELSERQLNVFASELRMRKFAKFVTFISLPAAALYYQRNFVLGVGSLLLSSFLAEKVYKLRIFNRNEEVPRHQVKKYKEQYASKILRANEKVIINPHNKDTFKRIYMKEFLELYKYR